MDFEHILDDLYLQLNEVRLHPKEAAGIVSKLMNQYQGKLFKNQIRTREGPQALFNLILDLSSRSPLTQRLKWSFALHMAADEQASILGQNGLYTTQGTNLHETLPERVRKYAIVKGRLSQIYEFGGKTPKEILQELLIDDGLTSRKRRNTLLDPIYKYIGIGCCYHEKHQACTVIILAEDIISLVAPDSAGKYKRRKGLETGKEFVNKMVNEIKLNNVPGQILQNAGGNSHGHSIDSSSAPFILPQSTNLSIGHSTIPANNAETVTYSTPGTAANQNSVRGTAINNLNSNTLYSQPDHTSIYRNTNQSINPPSMINQPTVVQNQQGSIVTYEPRNTNYVPSPNNSSNLTGTINSPSYAPAHTVNNSSINQSEANRIQQEQYEYYKNQGNTNPTNTNTVIHDQTENVHAEQKKKESKCSIM